jgi:hypothetical protein
MVLAAAGLAAGLCLPGPRRRVGQVIIRAIDLARLAWVAAVHNPKLGIAAGGDNWVAFQLHGAPRVPVPVAGDQASQTRCSAVIGEGGWRANRAMKRFAAVRGRSRSRFPGRSRSFAAMRSRPSVAVRGQGSILARLQTPRLCRVAMIRPRVTVAAPGRAPMIQATCAVVRGRPHRIARSAASSRARRVA